MTLRLHRWLPRLLMIAIVVAAFHLIFLFTGFDEWLLGNAVAKATVRILLLALFLGAGAAAIFLAREPEFRTWSYRLSAVFALFIAAAQIFILVNGEQSASKMFVTE